MTAINRVVACAVPPEDATALMAHLERTEDRVWLSRTVCCDRHTLRGVPARRVDILVDPVPPSAGQVLACTIVVKRGRFDGAERPRLALRRWPEAQPLAPGRLTVAEDGDDIRLTVEAGGPGWSAGAWSAAFRRLRSSLDGYRPARIVMWHWRRYFGFLPEAEAVALADAFIPSDGTTLAEANREASRDLYRLARSLGWRKLTLREKARLGLPADAPQWHRAESLPASEGEYPRDGAGEYSHRAARGAR